MACLACGVGSLGCGGGTSKSRGFKEAGEKGPTAARQSGVMGKSTRGKTP